LEPKEADINADLIDLDTVIPNPTITAPTQDLTPNTVAAVTTRAQTKIQNKNTTDTVDDTDLLADFNMTADPGPDPDEDRNHDTHTVAQQPINGDNSDTSMLDSDETPLLDPPTVMPSDYAEDNEFASLYSYLQTGCLPVQISDQQAKQLTLTADNHFIRDGLLYKVAMPRNKRLQRAYAVTERLCLPVKHRAAVLKLYHDRLGHFAIDRLFLTLFSLVYWKTMYEDVRMYCKSCDVCLRTKRNYNQKTTPLNPISHPTRPFQSWSLDYKDLTRRTRNGSVAILCIIDRYSNWPILIPVTSTSAEVTGKAFYEHVICAYGIPDSILSDRGSVFTSRFFSTLIKLMGVKHRISSSGAPRTNGLAESLVKRFSELVKLYATNDLELEDQIPLIQMCLRATNHTQIKISPFEVVFGFKMNVGQPQPSALDIPNFPNDQHAYLEWLKYRLQDIRQAVDINQAENKETMKTGYDRRLKAEPPNWAIGDQVMLLDKRIKPGSDKVLTHLKFKGPYYITDCIHSDSTMGIAYRLTDVNTGKEVKSLISSDRLKKYTANERIELDKRLPGVVTKQPVNKAPESLPPGYEPALRILKQRRNNGKIQYLVQYEDRSCWWSEADDVSSGLLEHYRLKQASMKEKNRRRQRKQ